MLKGKKVILRAMTRADVAIQYEHENDLEVKLLADDDPPVPRSLERLEKRFEGYLDKEPGSWFAIEADGKYIGGCGLFDYKNTDRTCQLGIVIGDKAYWGRGYGRDATRLLLDYAFRIRNMHKVWLVTGSHNERAIRAYLACGFVEEGRLRQHQWCDGRYEDHVYMGILRDEWGESGE